MTSASRHICILARKRLARNTRVFRQAKILSQAGHRVTVISLENPPQDLMDRVPGVAFFEATGRRPPGPAGTGSPFAPIKKKIKAVLADGAGASGPAAGPETTENASGGPRIHDQGIRPPAPRTGLKRWIPQGAGRAMRLLLRRFLVPLRNEMLSYRFGGDAVRLLAGSQIDYCQAHDSFALPAAARLARLHKAVLIYDAVEITADRSGAALKATPRWMARLFDRRDGLLVRRARHLTAIGPSLARWTRDHFHTPEPLLLRNCCLYENGDPSSSTLRGDIGLAPGHKVALAIGGLYDGGGIDSLVAALPALPGDVHAAVLGWESEMGYVAGLSALARSLSVEDRLHIIPAQPPDRVVSYARGADCGVIPIRKSSLNHLYVLPNKIFEMIMAGLPVAAADLPDLRDLVETHKLGLVFDEQDPRALAQALGVLLEPRTLERTREAVREAAKTLCWERESEPYVHLFN